MIAPIALTSGDPAGIGPEISAKAWISLKDSCPFFWIGDPSVLPDTVPMQEISTPEKALEIFPTALPVYPISYKTPPKPGFPAVQNAQAVIEIIKTAVDFVKNGVASAICTNPINKKTLYDGANFPFRGHTEYLSYLAGNTPVAMMLAGPELRVVPATIHLPLHAVPRALNPERLEQVIRVTWRALIQDFKILNPRIAISGLNPHAGEGGSMGREEIELIIPLIERLSQEQFNLTGPLPADTMFYKAARAKYDAAIAMYHDQALIPAKTLAFEECVNVTLGLPFIRTSPDHGTALDIAGQNKASPNALISALRMAAMLAKNRAGNGKN